jgi:DNA-directed RNA polymerase specialized sigma24 family protein
LQLTEKGMIETDQILIVKLKEGDIRSFQSIYHFYYPRIYNFCLKLLPASEDARDAAQKVFIAL